MVNTSTPVQDELDQLIASLPKTPASQAAPAGDDELDRIIQNLAKPNADANKTPVSPAPQFPQANAAHLATHPGLPRQSPLASDMAGQVSNFPEVPKPKPFVGPQAPGAEILSEEPERPNSGAGAPVGIVSIPKGYQPPVAKEIIPGTNQLLEELKSAGIGLTPVGTVASGLEHVAQGIGELANMSAQGLAARAGVRTSTTAPAPTGRQLAASTVKVLKGGAEIGSILVPYAAIQSPLRTVATLAGYELGSKGTEFGLEKTGVPKEYAELAGQVAGIGLGGISELGAEKAGKLFEPGGIFGEAIPVESLTDQQVMYGYMAARQAQNRPAMELFGREGMRRQSGKALAVRTPPAESGTVDPLDQIIAQLPKAAESQTSAPEVQSEVQPGAQPVIPQPIPQQPAATVAPQPSPVLQEAPAVSRKEMVQPNVPAQIAVQEPAGPIANPQEPGSIAPNAPTASQTPGIPAENVVPLGNGEASVPGPSGGGNGVGGGELPSTPKPQGRPTPVQHVQQLTEDLQRSKGLPSVNHSYPEVDQSLARRIADEYDALPADDSQNPEVQKAYGALKTEIEDQWDHAVKNGFKFEPWTKEGQPYANSQEMVDDVEKNKHLYFFTGGDNHPFLSEVDPQTGVVYNDMFRAIHDLYGYAAGGYGFGPRGEEGAWRTHSQSFSPEARRAMTTETRGQNSWVNFGRHNYDPTGKYLNIPPADRPFATQKVALLPKEFSGSEEGPAVARAAMPTPPSAVPPVPTSIEHVFDRAQEGRRGEREIAERVQVKGPEREAIATASQAAPAEQRRAFQRAAESQLRATRASFPIRGEVPFQPLEVAKVKAEKNEDTGEVIPTIEYKTIPYSFDAPVRGKKLWSTNHLTVEGEKASTQMADAVTKEVKTIRDEAMRARAQGDKPLDVHQSTALKIDSQKDWYNRMCTMLRKIFGSAGDLFADLLGTTSARTPVATNWKQAVEAIERATKGHYDKIIPPYKEFRQAGGNRNQYEGPRALRYGDAKYNANTMAVMDALSGLWRNKTGSPKTKNYAGNLIGSGDEATIDVWAARMLQRIRHQVFGDAPAVPQPAEVGVRGELTPEGTTGQFMFGQKVFEKAAKKLGMKPHELQAFLWFAEKDLWTRKGLNSAVGEGGDMAASASRDNLGRLTVGIAPQVSGEPGNAVKMMQSVVDVAKKSPDVKAIVNTPALGMWTAPGGDQAGTPEYSSNFEVTFKRSNPKVVNQIAAEVFRNAHKNAQDDAFVAKTVTENEESAVHVRPGISVYFKGPLDESDAWSVIEKVRTDSIGGFTLFSGPELGPGQYRGMRFIYMPEYVHEPSDVAGMDQPAVDKLVEDGRVKALNDMFDVQQKLESDPRIGHALIEHFDVLNGSKENYGQLIKQLEGGKPARPKGVGTSVAAGTGPWGRPLGEAVRARAVARVQSGGAPLDRADDLASRSTPIDGPAPLQARLMPGFYSQLERTIESKAPNKASPSQIANIINNPQNGVKPDEVKWTGLGDWLAQQNGPVTKQQVLDFVKSNDVQVQEIEKGAPRGGVEWVKGKPWENGRIEWNSKDGDIQISYVPSRPHLKQYELYDGNKSDLAPLKFATLDAAKKAAESKTSSTPTKFSGYVLPGGSNYRELLLTLPAEGLSPKIAVTQNLGGRYGLIDTKTREVLKGADGKEFWTDSVEKAEKMRNWWNKEKNIGYRSSHWDEPNVIAHIRFNDRTGPNGEKILHIEEIQSDWHQEGKRKGYAPQGEDRLRVEKEYTEAAKKYADSVQRIADIKNEIERTGKGSLEYSGAVADMARSRDAMETARANKNDGVPAAPFAKSWPELSFRRALRYAAENGYDKMTWTTGEQQSERYDLSKHIDTLSYSRNADGTFGLFAEKDGRALLDEGKIPVEKLEDYVGKEVAQKIVDGEGKADPDVSDDKFLSGVDLKVGGEGMKGFYDKILPDYANRYAKKWGAKVEKIRVYSSNRRGPNPPSGPTLHSIDITPSMKESVMAGQPLFSLNPSARTIESIDAGKPHPKIKNAVRPTSANPSIPEIKAYWEGSRSRPERIQGVPVVWVNNAAMDVVANRLGAVGRGMDSSTTAGLALSPGEWGNVLAESRAAEKSTKGEPFDQALVKIAGQIQSLTAKDPKSPVVVIQAGLDVHPWLVNRVLVEELNHANQMQIPKGLNGLPTKPLDTELGQKAAQSLGQFGYKLPNPKSPFYEHNRAVMSAEVSVRLMSPELYPELGLTPEEAVELATQYVDQLVAEHGDRAVEVVGRIYDTIDIITRQREADRKRQEEPAKGDKNPPAARSGGTARAPAEVVQSGQETSVLQSRNQIGNIPEIIPFDNSKFKAEQLAKANDLKRRYDEAVSRADNEWANTENGLSTNRARTPTFASALGSGRPEWLANSRGLVAEDTREKAQADFAGSRAMESVQELKDEILRMANSAKPRGASKPNSVYGAMGIILKAYSQRP